MSASLSSGLIFSNSRASRLGRQVARDAAIAAAIAGVASFVGAATPLLIGAITAPLGWPNLVVSVGALGALGGALGAAVSGRRVLWAVSMIVMGVALAALGSVLDIV